MPLSSFVAGATPSDDATLADKNTDLPLQQEEGNVDVQMGDAS